MNSLDYRPHWVTEFPWAEATPRREHYKRILVILGDEPCFLPVVHYALALATRHEGYVHFLSILSTAVVGGMPDMMASPAIDAANVLAYGEQLLAQAATAANEADVPYSTTLRWGNIPETIRFVATTQDYDAIVMPPSLGSGFEGWIHGCLPRRVAAVVGQPILAIPPLSVPLPEATVWRHATVVLSGTPTDDMTLQYALALAGEDRMRLCLLYIVPFGRKNARHYQHLMAATEARVNAAGVEYEMRWETGALAPAISATVTEYHSDVVLIGCHPKFTWRGLLRRWPSQATLMQSPVPVVCIPCS